MLHISHKISGIHNVLSTTAGCVFYTLMLALGWTIDTEMRRRCHWTLIYILDTYYKMHLPQLLATIFISLIAAVNCSFLTPITAYSLRLMFWTCVRGWMWPFFFCKWQVPNCKNIHLKYLNGPMAQINHSFSPTILYSIQWQVRGGESDLMIYNKKRNRP